MVPAHRGLSVSILADGTTTFKQETAIAATAKTSGNNPTAAAVHFGDVIGRRLMIQTPQDIRVEFFSDATNLHDDAVELDNGKTLGDFPVPSGSPGAEFKVRCRGVVIAIDGGLTAGQIDILVMEDEP